MDGYFNCSQRFAKIKSKRLQKAVAAIRGSKNDDIDLVGGDDSTPKKRGRKRNAAASAEVGTSLFLNVCGQKDEGHLHKPVCL